MDPKIIDGCDSGQPIVVTHPDSPQVINLTSKILFVLLSSATMDGVWGL
jgi:hypothetical protein